MSRGALGGRQRVSQKQLCGARVQLWTRDGEMEVGIGGGEGMKRAEGGAAGWAEGVQLGGLRGCSRAGGWELQAGVCRRSTLDPGACQRRARPRQAGSGVQGLGWGLCPGHVLAWHTSPCCPHGPLPACRQSPLRSVTPVRPSRAPGRSTAVPPLGRRSAPRQCLSPRTRKASSGSCSPLCPQHPEVAEACRR